MYVFFSITFNPTCILSYVVWTANIEKFQEYDCKKVGTFQTMMILECRGCAPIKWEPRNGFVVSSETFHSDDADFTELDYSEYDEEGDVPVSVMEIETLCS